MNQDSKKAPVLRFKGFSDDWEQRKLGEVATFHNGDRGRNYPQESELVKIGIPFINAGDLINGKIDTNNCKKITPDKFNSLRGAKLKIGDIVYCLRGTLGKNAINLDVSIGTIASSLVLIRPVKINNHYLFQILNSDVGNKQILKFDEGAVQPNLSVKNLRKFVIPYASKLEQDKIAKLMSLISENLTLQQRKLKQLKSFKKGITQQLINSKSDDWIEYNFLDLIEKIIDFRGKTPKKLKSTWSTKGHIALSALNVKQGYVDKNASVHFGNDDLYKIWMTGNELYQGQVLLTTEAPVGNVAQVPDNEKYILSQRVIALVPNEKLITNDFLAFILSTPRVQNDLQRLATGGTAQGISQRSLKHLKITIPKNLENQIRITNIVNNINENLMDLDLQINNCKKIKKFLLQNMFI